MEKFHFQPITRVSINIEKVNIGQIRAKENLSIPKK
uniref:Uncharacterized protein n=1 Tax=Rhizophora mucronata TaxID=61149 RepID=A0A2P2QA40_RHIMU